MNIKRSYIAITLLLILTSFFSGFAQQTKEEKKQQEYAQIQNLVNSKNYVFVAQTVLPLGGRVRNLTSPYDLKVAGDTVISDLPYFGRAFVAPIDPAEGGIRFTSTNFSYN